MYITDSQACTSANPETKKIMLRWFQKLNFPEIYHKPFIDAMERIFISDALTPDNYDWNDNDGQRNFLSVLYMCEGLSKQYTAYGISEDILMDTLGDIVRWLKTWSDLKSDLFLGELPWLQWHMRFNLFQLGRLQFRMGEAGADIPDANVRQGDPVLEIHIPNAGPLTPEECENSIAMAKAFFAKYFPEFDWKVFICHSWLLDDTLAQFLPANSNILKFQKQFTLVEKHRSDSILGYVFTWKTNREQVKDLVARSSFAKAVKAHIGNNGDFYVALGYIPKER